MTRPSVRGAKRSVMLLSTATLFGFVTCACNCSSASLTTALDPRAGAIQRYLDAHPEEADIPLKQICNNNAESYQTLAAEAKRYAGSFARVRPDPMRNMFMGPPYSSGLPNCWRIVWSKGLAIKSVPNVAGGSVPNLGSVVVAHYIVTKAGAPGESAFGMRSIPFRAVLEPTPVGAFLMKMQPPLTVGGSIASSGQPLSKAYPLDAADFHAMSHQDADGMEIVDGVDFQTQQ